MKKLHDIRTQYNAKPLVLEEMSHNPVEQFTQWFSEIEKFNLQDSNAATLSTYDSQLKRVRSRVILIKEITTQGIIFFSNYESDKGKEILSHPQVALNIYWPVTFRQVRLEGRVVKIDSKLSEEYFLSRPRESQISAIVSHQSAEIASRKILEERYQKLLESSEPLVRPFYWGGLEIISNYWEFWQGRNHRLHDRVCYQKLEDNSWKKKILEP